MPPIRKGDGTVLTPKGIAEVRKGDGTVLYSPSGSDIPDSEANQKLAHRWLLDSVSDGTAEDSEGSADGTVNGVSQVSGDWAGGSAGDGDGVDDNIDSIGQLTGWTDSLASGGAIAYSFNATTTGDTVFGAEDSQIARIETGLDSGGEIRWQIRSETGQTYRILTDGTFNDGNEHRVVVTYDGGGLGDGLNIWVDQTDVPATYEVQQQPASFDGTFLEDFTIFSNNEQGTVNQYFGGIVDDVCLFSDLPTSSEIQSYQNPWS